MESDHQENNTTHLVNKKQESGVHNTTGVFCSVKTYIGTVTCIFEIIYIYIYIERERERERERILSTILL
jgi:predicted SPOUT superfamily RNA methylase MTH1